MVVVYKHFTFPQLLLIYVLMVDIGGLVDAAKGHIHRRYFTDPGRFRNHREINPRKNKSANTAVKKMPPPVDDDTMNTANIPIVTAQAGSRAILHCDTSKLGDIGKENTTVIWIRMYDLNPRILTDGDKVLTDDKRFFATNRTGAKDWSLHIRYTQCADEGVYQCQLCNPSEPSKIGIFVKLILIEAQAIIIGAPEKVVEKVGSPLRLSCMLENSIEAPAYIFWYHEDRMINYDLNDGATVRDGRQGSELIFPRAQRKHAGNYSCVPSNARQASVKVVISSSETSGTENKNKNSGEKYPAQEHIVNMLVLISTFHLYR